jgi:hypothetical protein
LPAAFFAGAGLAAGRFDCFEAGDCLAAGRDVLEDLEAADDLAAGAAFRTGAFSAAARLGLGFAAAAVNFRLLTEDFDTALCGAGREELLFAPLMTGSLMRSTRFSQIASPSEGKPPTSSSLTHEMV